MCRGYIQIFHLYRGLNPRHIRSVGHGHHHHESRHSHGAGEGHSRVAQGVKNRKRLGLAAVLTGLFMIVDVIGGVLSGSLALLADAGHMVTDYAALAMASLWHWPQS